MPLRSRLLNTNGQHELVISRFNSYIDMCPFFEGRQYKEWAYAFPQEAQSFEITFIIMKRMYHINEAYIIFYYPCLPSAGLIYKIFS